MRLLRLPPRRFSFWSAASCVTPLIPAIASVRRAAAAQRASLSSLARDGSGRPLRLWVDAFELNSTVSWFLMPICGPFFPAGQTLTQYNGIQGALTLYLSIKARQRDTDHTAERRGRRWHANPNTSFEAPVNLDSTSFRTFLAPLLTRIFCSHL